MRIGIVLCLVVWPGWGQATSAAEPGAWLQARAAAHYAWQTQAYDTGYLNPDAAPGHSQALALWSVGCQKAQSRAACQRLHFEMAGPPPVNTSGPPRFIGLLAATLILTALWTACSFQPHRSSPRR